MTKESLQSPLALPLGLLASLACCFGLTAYSFTVLVFLNDCFQVQQAAVFREKARTHF